MSTSLMRPSIIDNNCCGGGRRIWFSESFTDNGQENVVGHFYRKLKSLEKDIFNRLEMNEPMRLSLEDEENFKKSKTCYVCYSPFKRKSDKCRDHNHTSG